MLVLKEIQVRLTGSLPLAVAVAATTGTREQPVVLAVAVAKTSTIPQKQVSLVKAVLAVYRTVIGTAVAVAVAEHPPLDKTADPMLVVLLVLVGHLVVGI
jgi:hypothetical protein